MAGGVEAISGDLHPTGAEVDHTSYTFKRMFTHYVKDGIDATGYDNSDGTFDEGWSFLPYDYLMQCIPPREWLSLKLRYRKFRIKSFSCRIFRYWPLADTSRTVSQYTTMYTTIAQRVAMHVWVDNNHSLPQPRPLGGGTYATLYNVNNQFLTPLMLDAEAQSGATLQRCEWQFPANIGANEVITPFTVASLYNQAGVHFLEPGTEWSHSWSPSGDDTKRWYNFGNATIDGVATTSNLTLPSQYLNEPELQSMTSWNYRKPPPHIYIRVDPVYGGDNAPILLTGKFNVEYTCTIEVEGTSLFSAMAFGPTTLGAATSGGRAQTTGPAVQPVNNKNLMAYNASITTLDTSDPYRIYQPATTAPTAKRSRYDFGGEHSSD